MCEVHVLCHKTEYRRRNVVNDNKMLAKSFWQLQASALQRTLRDKIQLERLAPSASRALERVWQVKFPGDSLQQLRQGVRSTVALVSCALRRCYRRLQAAPHPRLEPGAQVVPKIQISTYIAATPEQVWDALTNPAITEQYWSNTRVESDWQVGSTIYYRRHGKMTHEQVVLHAEPRRMLRCSFYPVTTESLHRELPSRLSFEITSVGRMTRLTLIHDGFDLHSPQYRPYQEFWPMLLSNLKTLLETGRPLFGD